MGIKDPYKAIMARDKFVRMGESERALVHRAPMQAATQRAFGLVRQAVMAIPDRLARDMAGFPADRVAQWRREARDYCQEALADAASAIRDMDRWRKEYGGLQIDQARKMKDLERENARLRRLVADLSLEKQVLADVASGNL